MVSLLCVIWSGVRWRRRESGWRLMCWSLSRGLCAGLGYPVGRWRVGVARSGGMWLASSVFWRAWVGPPACFGRRASVGLSFLGACALVWWCLVLSGGSSYLGVWLGSRSGVAWPSRLGLFSSRGCLPFLLSPFYSPSPVLWLFPLPSPGVSALVSMWWLLQCRVAGVGA